MMTGLNTVWRPGVPWFGGCTIFNSEKQENDIKNREKKRNETRNDRSYIKTSQSVTSTSSSATGASRAGPAQSDLLETLLAVVSRYPTV